MPRYAFFIALVCLGYPKRQQRERELEGRLDEKHVVFEDRYSRHGKEELGAMIREREERVFGQRPVVHGARNIGQMTHLRRLDSDFAREMNRSVRAMVQAWVED